MQDSRLTDQVNRYIEKTVRRFENKTSEFIARPVVEALTRSDQGALRSVYLQLYDGLKEFLKYLLNNDQDAEEALQDTFLYLMEHPEKINPDKNFRGYLYTIAKNLAFKQLINRGKSESYTNFRLKCDADFSMSPEELVMTDELALMVTVYIENLPPQRRRVYELSRMEGKTIKEIAEIMQLSTNTVKSHLQTANNGLRELISLFIALFMLP